MIFFYLLQLENKKRRKKKLLQNSWMICSERLNPLPAFTGCLSLLNRYAEDAHM